ncbi:MAG: NfeD family protein [Prevotella sp.]
MIELLNENLWAAWLVIAFVCLLTELFTGSFYILCFAVGAVAAAIVSPFCGIYVQLVAFIGVSLVSIFLVRPIVMRCLHHEEDFVPSNADAIMGREAIVSQAIPANGYGRVALDGDDWKATAKETIEKGEKVIIVNRESIILTVKKL